MHGLRWLCTRKHDYWGDFNLTLNCRLDRLNSTNNNNRAAKFLKEFMEVYNYVDVRRDLNANECKYSWFRKKPDLAASRINFFLVNPGLASHVEEVKYCYGCRSDHSLIEMKIWNRIKVLIDIVNNKFSTVPARIDPIPEIENELQTDFAIWLLAHFAHSFQLGLGKIYQLATDNNINFSHRSNLIYEAILEKFHFNSISEESKKKTEEVWKQKLPVSVWVFCVWMVILFHIGPRFM